MYWLIYTISNNKKRNKIKLLYENMLTTYVSMADDIFGNNQTNNPSIQDCMFEIIDTDKYQVKRIEDVPIAKVYYSKHHFVVVFVIDIILIWNYRIVLIY